MNNGKDHNEVFLPVVDFSDNHTDFPGIFSLFVAFAKCNLDCSGCFVYEYVMSDDNVRLLPTSEVIDSLTQSGDLYEGLVISGGEPTLHDSELKHLLHRVLDETHVKTCLFTNGTRPEVLRELCDSGLLSRIRIGIKHPEELSEELRDFYVNTLCGIAEFTYEYHECLDIDWLVVRTPQFLQDPFYHSLIHDIAIELGARYYELEMHD